MVQYDAQCRAHMLFELGWTEQFPKHFSLSIFHRVSFYIYGQNVQAADLESGQEC